jgi:hypothetical protein
MHNNTELSITVGVYKGAHYIIEQLLEAGVDRFSLADALDKLRVAFPLDEGNA